MKRRELEPAESLTGHLWPRPTVERNEAPLEYDEEVLSWLKYLGDTHMRFGNRTLDPLFGRDAHHYLEQVREEIASVRTLCSELGLEREDFAIIGRTFGYAPEGTSSFKEIADSQGTSERRIKDRLGELSLLLADSDWSRRRRELVALEDRDPAYRFRLN